MNKKYLNIFFLIGLHLSCFSQNTQRPDSMSTKIIEGRRQQLFMVKDDSSRITAFENLGFSYERLNVDSSLKYFNAGLDLARQKSYAWGEARLLAGLLMQA